MKDAMSELSQDFSAILLTDVIAALRRRETADTQSSRRDIIRTSFAAIEGFVWIMREHVIEIAEEIGGLEREERGALNESQFQVTRNGKVVEQARYIPFIPTVRLLFRIASRLSPGLEINFGAKGWDYLRQSIEIRNRITHPKCQEDLTLADGEVTIATEALFWLLDKVVLTMDHSLKIHREHLSRIKEVANALINGDPAMIALYKQVQSLE